MVCGGVGPPGCAREHSETCTTWRNGHRDRVLTTQAGDLDLKIPKVRDSGGVN
jgi:transposase-like protein